jgi:hypothetical protein
MLCQQVYRLAGAFTLEEIFELSAAVGNGANGIKPRHMHSVAGSFQDLENAWEITGERKLSQANSPKAEEPMN